MEKQCRICLETDNPSDMISPCQCSGTSKYVHRNCLDQWRTLSTNDNAMTRCLECNTEYMFSELENREYNCIQECFKFLSKHSIIFSLLNVFFFLSIGTLTIYFDKDHVLLIKSNDGKIIYLHNYFYVSVAIYFTCTLSIFLINIYFQRNRRLYIDYYFSIPRKNTLLILFTISCILIYLAGIFGLMLFICLLQVLLNHHYKVMKRIENTYSLQVLDLGE